MGYQRRVHGMIRLKRGLLRWLASTNHKDIGTLYFIFGLFSGFVGRIFRLLIRTELRIPGPTFLSERAYNVIITAHGLIIIFFFCNTCFNGRIWKLITPLAFRMWGYSFSSFTIYLFDSYLLVYLYLLLEVWWTQELGQVELYIPLSRLVGHQGMGVDLGIFRIHIAGASRIGGSINFLCTIINLRSPYVTEKSYLCLFEGFFSLQFF